MFSCFGCCSSEGKTDDDKSIYDERSLKKSNQEYKKTKSFASLSTKNDASKRRYITEEIAKLGESNIYAETFTLDELSGVTRNFNPEYLIGEGGFGRVYKGHIDSKGIDVAVKQLDRNGFQGNKEFLVEVLVLSHLQHPNLVSLVGYCAEGNQRILVYEYMMNGSLEDHLLNISPDRKPLDWNTRMKIVQGAARGLEYLHESADPPVIYRDFKASNILLDDDFNPKLSDFGFAKMCPVGENANASRVIGTYGYCAPEYAATGLLSTKSDVYSFGVVLLEIISGRRMIDARRPIGEQNMITWAEPLFKDKRKFHLMADPLLEGEYPERELYQALAIAAMCLQGKPATRPSIADAVSALEYMYARRNRGDNNKNNNYNVEREEDEDKDKEDDHNEDGYFGVVLLEIISGRRMIDARRPVEEQNMITWAEPLFKDKRKFHLMADPLLEGKYPERELYQALAIAAMCLQGKPATRPSIVDAVSALEYM